MNDVGDIWGQAAEKWTELSSQLSDSDLAKASSCGEWSVQELVDHTMHWQAAGGGVFGAGTKPGDDWATIRPAVQAALGDPSNLEGVAEAFGNMPKQGVAGLIIADLLLHSWDLAQSIGADATLPEAAAESTLMGLQRLPEEMLRSDTMFAAAVEVPDDASIQDKLVAFAGRTP